MIATVIIAKCKISKESFGIRAQKDHYDWTLTWSFPVSDRIAKREGYDVTTISGRIRFDEKYPGCPHCGEKGFAQCGHCQKVICCGESDKDITCPHCGSHLETEDSETFDNISGGLF